MLCDRNVSICINNCCPLLSACLVLPKAPFGQASTPSSWALRCWVSQCSCQGYLCGNICPSLSSSLMASCHGLLLFRREFGILPVGPAGFLYFFLIVHFPTTLLSGENFSPFCFVRNNVTFSISSCLPVEPSLYIRCYDGFFQTSEFTFFFQGMSVDFATGVLFLPISGHQGIS